MEWIEVEPEQENWKKQINVVAYYGSQIIGSIVLTDAGWESVIDGSMDIMDADTQDDAKTEMINNLESHFESEINYYRELAEMLERMD